MTSDESPIVLPDDPSFGPEVQVDYPGYRSTRSARPTGRSSSLPGGAARSRGPGVRRRTSLDELDNDLTRQHDGEPLGERIIVTGRVLDEDGRPIRGALVEIWQANAAGRYHHEVDRHPAPLDPNFSGARPLPHGRRGPLPLRHDQAGRVSVGQPRERVAPRAHPLLRLRPAFTQRLVTQMYFPGDPLFAYDPIFNSVRDPKARALLVARFDLDDDEARVGARLSAGTSSSAAAVRHDAGRDDDASRARRRRPSGRTTRSASAAGPRTSSCRRDDPARCS